MKIKVYGDPGHAWAVVPRRLLIKLGIEDQVSPYSYQRMEMAYLEEDCDLSLFMSAMQKHGISVSFDEHHGNKRSRIRGYNSYRPLSTQRNTNDQVRC